jgi:transposase
MFHVMKPVNEELNKVRKQTRMTLKGSKFILLKNGVDLTEEQKVKLADILKHSQRLKLTYELKEEFRDIFECSQAVEAGKQSNSSHG